MKERKGDMFKAHAEYDAVCVTTNGFVKANGAAVMGRGTARQFAHMVPGADRVLGTLIRQYGNVTQEIQTSLAGVTYVSLPVKHNWFEPADPLLIQQSLARLDELADERGWERIALPRPGCGNGGLKWTEVQQLCKFLDDRFEIWSL